jgi:hypothetical protein
MLDLPWENRERIQTLQSPGGGQLSLQVAQLTVMAVNSAVGLTASSKTRKIATVKRLSSIGPKKHTTSVILMRLLVVVSSFAWIGIDVVLVQMNVKIATAAHQAAQPLIRHITMIQVK